MYTSTRCKYFSMENEKCLKINILLGGKLYNMVASLSERSTMGKTLFVLPTVFFLRNL